LASFQTFQAEQFGLSFTAFCSVAPVRLIPKQQQQQQQQQQQPNSNGAK
jgi:hypothetical protein